MTDKVLSKQLKVTVTNKDIALGKQYNQNQCPINIAIRRTVGPDATYIKVTPRYVALTLNGYRYFYQPSKAAIEFVIAFDKGKENVSQRTFVFEIKNISENGTTEEQRRRARERAREKALQKQTLTPAQKSSQTKKRKKANIKARSMEG